MRTTFDFPDDLLKRAKRVAQLPNAGPARTINEHQQNIFSKDELSWETTVRKFRKVRQEGARQVAMRSPTA